MIRREDFNAGNAAQTYYNLSLFFVNGLEYHMVNGQ